MNWRRICAIMKVRIGMIAVLSGFIFVIAGCSLHTDEVSEQSEKNEQADESGLPEENMLAEVEEIDLEADVKTADTYMEEAQAYIEAEDYLAAIEVLMEGVEETGDETLAEKEKDLREHIIVLKKKEYINGKLRGEYEYDTAGNEVKAISYNDDGIYAWCESEYDKDGNCTKYTEYLGDGSIKEWSEYTYDAMGNKTKAIEYEGTDSIYYWGEYEYNEKGNETKRIVYFFGGSTDQTEYEWEYEYDEMGNVIKKTCYNEYGSSWEKYEYDEMGNCTSDIGYHGDGTVFSTHSRQYDEMGNQITEFYKDSNIEYRKEYEYDDMGNKTKEIEYRGNGIRSSRYDYKREYEYDEKGHLIRYTHYHDDDVLDLCFEFAYDEMGNLIKESSSTEGYVEEYEYEYASETAGQICSTVIGNMEILEKSLQTTIEVEGWSRVGTWDLKYPYFNGDQVVLLREINNQIYEWVRDKNMVDSEDVYYTELTYEITYMDERFVSILFEGEGGGSSYYGYSHGMSFDLKTGELLSLTDFYEWPEWKDLMQNAMEQGQLSTQILRGYMELEEEENREYLEEYFIPLF